jgi:hypothetical protein
MIGNVIEWKLKQLGKFDGAKITTRDGVITSWDANGEPQPDQSTLDSWIAEYQASIPVESNQKRARKRQLLDAIATLTGLTRKQVLRCFNEIVSDANDD